MPSLNVQALGQSMITQAATIGKDQWDIIREAATIELQGLAQRLVAITNAFLGGQITKSMAKRHLRTARSQVIATIAMLTSMVEAAAEKIINAVLTVVRDAVNTAIGFTLIV